MIIVQEKTQTILNLSSSSTRSLTNAAKSHLPRVVSAPQLPTSSISATIQSDLWRTSLKPVEQYRWTFFATSWTHYIYLFKYKNSKFNIFFVL